MSFFADQSIYEILKDVATLIVTIIGLVIAGMGLATWKKQLRGTREFEIAHNLYSSILELREAIKSVRNPAIFIPEINKAVRYAKEKYPEKESDDLEKRFEPYVYEMRWEAIKKAAITVESHLLEAEALWGSDIREIWRPLNRKINELNIALGQHLRPEFKSRDVMEIHEIIYDQSSEECDDKYASEINSIIREINKYIQDKTS